MHKDSFSFSGFLILLAYIKFVAKLTSHINYFQA